MKVQNPIIGRARGSAGGMTFCKNYDKNVARAKAFEVSDPNTQAQQTQRNFFKQLTALCADFSEDQLRTLFPSKPKTMSRRNALTKQIAQSYAIDGTEKTIDFANIDTLGNAPVMDFGVTSFDYSRTDPSVILDTRVSQNQSLGDYYFICALVNETQGEIYISTDHNTVSAGSLIPTLPPTWTQEDNIHAIPLITNVTRPNPFKGFGSFIIKTRPEDKSK